MGIGAKVTDWEDYAGESDGEAVEVKTEEVTDAVELVAEATESEEAK